MHFLPSNLLLFRVVKFPPFLVSSHFDGEYKIHTDKQCHNSGHDRIACGRTQPAAETMKMRFKPELSAFKILRALIWDGASTYSATSTLVALLKLR